MKPHAETAPQRSALTVLNALLDGGGFPHLNDLARSEGGEAVLAELVTLIERFVPPRAPRLQKKILAKLLRETDMGALEEPVVIRDISATGTLLAVPLHTGLTARDLKEVRLRLRVPGSGDILVKARLVRVSGSDRDFVYAGFCFDAAPKSLGALLGDLRHATSLRPSLAAQDHASPEQEEGLGLVLLGVDGAALDAARSVD